jgi:hypothetical protein
MEEGPGLVAYFDNIPVIAWNGDDKGYANFCKTWPGWNSKIKDTVPRISNIST